MRQPTTEETLTAILAVIPTTRLLQEYTDRLAILIPKYTEVTLNRLRGEACYVLLRDGTDRIVTDSELDEVAR